jgi:hypothetical protein
VINFCVVDVPCCQFSYFVRLCENLQKSVADFSYFVRQECSRPLGLALRANRNSMARRSELWQPAANARTVFEGLQSCSL